MPVAPRCLLAGLLLTTVSSVAAQRQPSANIISDGSVYRDCSDLPSNMSSGVYTLRPGLWPLDVPAYCDMESDGGGWTVVIRRADIEPRQDFNGDWAAYKWGIGDLENEFYWGNEYLWMLTSHLDRQYQVHFWLEDWDGNTRHALYQNFAVEAEEGSYRLHVGEYSGDAGDSFSYNDNIMFTTYDRDSSRGFCVDYDRVDGGWWYDWCSRCHLAGTYYDGGHSGDSDKGITWNDWKGADPYSLKSAVMKIKPSD